MEWKLFKHRSSPNLVRQLIQCVHLNVKKSWFQLLSDQSKNDNDHIDLCKNMLSCPVYFLYFCNNLYVNGKYIIIKYIYIYIYIYIYHASQQNQFFLAQGSMAISVKRTVYDTIVHSDRSKPIQHLPHHLHFLFRTQLYHL